MQIVLGGLLEHSMIRKYDHEFQPDRNTTPHPYYISLNRDTPDRVKSRCDSFLVLSDSVIIPSVDWNPPFEKGGPLSYVGCPSVPQDHEIRKLAEVLIENRAFSRATYKAISDVELSRTQSPKDARQVQRSSATMYVERILLQSNLAQTHKSILVLTETDILALREIGRFILEHRFPTPFDIPDLRTSGVFDGDALGVLTNFSARDISQINKIRHDKTIRSYAREIQKVLSSANIGNSEIALVNALREARKDTNIVKRFDRGFEVFSWVTKPLSYVPALSFGVTITNDVLSLFRKWIDRKSSDVNWHMLGAKLEELRLEDYMSRKGNMK